MASGGPVGLGGLLGTWSCLDQSLLGRFVIGEFLRIWRVFARIYNFDQKIKP